MRLSKRYILLSIILITCAVTLMAQVSFTVSAPQQVREGENFYVTYILKNATGKNLKFNDIKGAKLLYGPAVGTSQSMTIVNGHSSSSSTEEYTLTYRAVKTGKYNIPGATIFVNGKNYTCANFSINIVASNKTTNTQRGQVSSSPYDSFDDIDDAPKVGANDVFIRISLSKSSAYEQEAILCTIKLYSKYDVSSIITTSSPTFNGFLIEKLNVASSFNNVEKIGGKTYKVADLEKYILFPQQTGKLTVASGDYDLTVIQYQKAQSRFGGYSLIPCDSKIKVHANPTSINVLPLPNPKPASFTGAVGVFTISSKLKSNQFKTNEESIYELDINGTGNLKYIKAPKIGFPTQFDAYEAQTEPKVTPSGNNMSGSLICKYTVVPQNIGKFEIKSSEFSYFNPSIKKYVTLTIPFYSVTVSKGSNNNSATQDKKDILLKNKDILHIKTNNLEVKKEIKFLISSNYYSLFYVIPTVLFILILIYYRKTIKERSNVMFMKSKKAGKVAKKRLKLAKLHLAKHDETNFYAEILNATWGYISDKLGIPLSSLNKDNIKTELEKYGADENLIEKLIKLLDDCEFAQYAPENSDSKMDSIFEMTSILMDKLENQKK